jgi:hypothetical protein
MTERISAKTREALGRLAQVVSCADRALTRDVLHFEQITEYPHTDESTGEEGVDPSGDALSDSAGKRLLLRVI